MAAHSRGTIALAEGRTSDALIELRRALTIWTELDAPYEAARVRLALGLACRTAGDHDTASLEMEAARIIFKKLGAVSELARATSLAPLAGANTAADRHGLTGRELQVCG